MTGINRIYVYCLCEKERAPGATLGELSGLLPPHAIHYLLCHQSTLLLEPQACSAGPYQHYHPTSQKHQHFNRLVSPAADGRHTTGVSFNAGE